MSKFLGESEEMIKIVIYYKNIPIIDKNICLSKEQRIVLEEIQKNKLSRIEIIEHYKKDEIRIYTKDYYDLKYIVNSFDCITMSEFENEEIWYCVDMLESLSDNINFFVDETTKKYSYMNFSEVIANRNLMDLEAFMNNLSSNKLICFFALRDIIENLKVYLYLIRGEIVQKKQNSTITFEDIDAEIREKKIRKLHGEERMTFDMKQLLENTPSISFLKGDLKKIENINIECNNYIHKNGYDKMNVEYLKVKDLEYMKEQVIYVLKIFFMVVVCFDGKAMAASDYFDCIDNNIEPIKDSQYWIAPVYQDFIDKMLKKKEKQNIIEHSYMKIE